MDQSKLLLLLKTFSREEIQSLEKFLANPMFFTRGEALRLLQAISGFLVHKRPIPDKQKLFSKVFDKGDYDDHRMRMAMSALLQGASKFLAIQDFMKDTADYQFRLSKLLRERNLPALAASSLQEAMNGLAARRRRNAEHLYDEYKFQEERYRAVLDLPEVETQDLQLLSDGLDVAFLSRKLWQSCFLLTHQARYNAACDFGLLQHILPAAQKYLHHPAVAIYYYCYLALTTPSENQYFLAFKKTLLEFGGLFPPDELRDLYILAINFCTRRYNEGDMRYLQDQFELYKIGFDNQYFLSDGVLSRFTYLNAATIGLKIRAFEWVERFIIEYRESLEPSYRDSLFAFNMARLSYQKSDYGEALVLLQKAEYKETMLALAAKTLQMKIYYASEEYDLLGSHLQAIAAFIRRKKIMGYHRDNYLNLLHFVRKLMDIGPMDKKSKLQLKEQVAQTKPLAEKEWLLDQL